MYRSPLTDGGVKLAQLALDELEALRDVLLGLLQINGHERGPDQLEDRLIAEEVQLLGNKGMRGECN